MTLRYRRSCKLNFRSKIKITEPLGLLINPNLKERGLQMLEKCEVF